MAWDDTPPTAEEINPSTAPAAGGWDSAPPTPDELKMTLGGFAKNALEDVKGNVAGVGQLAKGLLTHPVNTLNAIPAGIEQEAKRLGGSEFIHGDFPGAGKKFAEAAYEKPVSTGLDVATLFGLGKGAAGAMSGAVTPAEIAAETGQVGETVAEAAPVMAEGVPAAEPIKESVATPEVAPNVSPKVTEAPKEAPAANAAPITAEPPTLGKIASNIASNIPTPVKDTAKEVNDYVSRKFQGIKTPGGIVDYVQHKSQMASLQQMGFTPRQAGEVGKSPTEVLNEDRAIGQYGLDSGIVSGTTGLKGMVEKNQKFLDAAGSKLDQLRKEADKYGAPYKPGELLRAVKAKLDPIYQRGVTEESPTARGSEGTGAAAYLRGLQDIEDADQTHSGIAKAVTKINKAATLETKMRQNPGPYTDIANTVSEINNDRIKAIIGPQKAAEYEQSLREYGINKKISNGLRMKIRGEVKRFGPGSTISNLIQKGMDEFGYKVGAKAANKVSSNILKTPAVAKNLPSLFKNFINEVEEESKEIGLSEGGMVTPAMAQYVRGR